MKFFWTGNFKISKPIQIAISFFIFFIFLFWIGNFIYFGLKFGYSVEEIEHYFFGEEDFPVEISPSQVAEDAHINLFVFSLLFLCISAILAYNRFSEKMKIYFIVAFAILGLLYVVSDYLVLYLGREFAFLKLVLFLVFQFMIFVSVILSLRRGAKNGSGKLLGIIIFLFALLNFSFVFFNFVLFVNKVGFGISGIVDYYLGNPQKFMKPKSTLGLIEISYFHFLPMALYLVTLSHFVFLVSNKFNVGLTISLFLSALVDNVSGILIILFGGSFAVVKFISFFILQILLLISSFVLIYKLLLFRFSFPNRADNGSRYL
jgi:hypothetical protein